MLTTAARPTCHATLAEGWRVTVVQLWVELLQPLAHISCGPCSHREREAEGGKLGVAAGQSGLRRRSGEKKGGGVEVKNGMGREKERWWRIGTVDEMGEHQKGGMGCGRRGGHTHTPLPAHLCSCNWVCNFLLLLFQTS